jgi:Domain of unknown function (DUF4411)
VANPSPSVVYVLDSNVLIEAKKRYYNFDVCPGFWEALVWQHQQGAIVSVDRVKAEVDLGKDDLTDWCSLVMPADCFKGTDAPGVTDAYRDALNWVMAQPLFKPEAKAEFANEKVADAWVIAYAKAFGATVVTEEKLNLEKKKKVLIPNVCVGLGVPYVDTFEMLRALSTRFEWEP